MLRCQVCGVARATRRDDLGREICNKTAHEVAVNERRQLKKLQDTLRSETLPADVKGTIEGLIAKLRPSPTLTERH